MTNPYQGPPGQQQGWGYQQPSQGQWQNQPGPGAPQNGQYAQQQQAPQQSSWNIGGQGGNSFPFDNIGDHVTGYAIDLAEVQQTDPDDGTPLTWPNGDKRMQYRLSLQTELRDPARPDDTGRRDVYLRGSRTPEADGTKSSLCAVQDAVRDVTGGTEIQYGAKVTLQYVANGPKSRPAFSAPKRYAAWYEAPSMNLGGQQQAPQQQVASSNQMQQPPVGGSYTGQQVQAETSWQHQQQAPIAPPPGQQQNYVQQQVAQEYQYNEPSQRAIQPGAQPPSGPGTDPWQQFERPQEQPGWVGAPSNQQQMQQPPAAQAQGMNQFATNQQQQQAPAAGEPITQEKIAGLNSIGVDPATIYGPDWQSRVIG